VSPSTATAGACRPSGSRPLRRPGVSPQCEDPSARPKPPRPITQPGPAPQTPTTYKDAPVPPSEPFPARRDSPRPVARPQGIAYGFNRVGSMLTVFFCPGPVEDFASARASDTARFGRFFHAMLERGVYLPPAQFEAAFVSLAHGPAEIDQTVEAASAAFRDVAAAG
jgi:hypothetical protein